jgi:hypothetical protein
MRRRDGETHAENRGSHHWFASRGGGTGGWPLRGAEFFKISHKAASPTSSAPKNSMNSSFGVPPGAVPPGVAPPGAVVAAGVCGGVPAGGCPANAIAPKAAINTNQYRETVTWMST